jgi:hypothetical protein
VADSLGGVVGAERPLGKGANPNFSLSSLFFIFFLDELSDHTPNLIIISIFEKMRIKYFVVN